MPSFRPVFVEDQIYHVYNRGIDDREVFLNEEYYTRFVNGLKLFNSVLPVQIRDFVSPGIKSQEERRSKNVAEKYNEVDKLVEIGAFILKPTHYHLLLRQKKPKGVPLFMQKLGVGYTGFFNLKQSRKGPIFQGTYRAKIIDNNVYARHIHVYIALNALDEKMPEWREGKISNIVKAEQLLTSHPWSSIGAVISGSDRFKDIVYKGFENQFFDGVDDLKKEIRSWGAGSADILKKNIVI